MVIVISGNLKAQISGVEQVHPDSVRAVFHSSRAQRWVGLITSFLAGQGTVQLLNLFAGFLLLRWMSVEAYAQYSVAFGFQSTLGMLVDLGFSGSIIALVGERSSDLSVVGRYVRSARYFRNRLFVVFLPLAIIGFPLFISKHHWPWSTQVLLMISIGLALFFQGWVSFYSTPLLIKQNINRYYRPQIITALGRNVFCVVLYLASALTSWATALVSSAVIVVNSLIYRKETKQLVHEPDKSDLKANSEMLRYISPLIPGIVFTAFQGQISVLLITWFGQTRSVAEVAALGRLGQVFLILGAFNAVIVNPYVARVARPNLGPRYLQFVGAATVISIIVCVIAFLFPDPFLWTLGPKYRNLRTEVSWLLAVSGLNYVGAVMWTIHSARRWIFWWGTFAYIGVLLITQAVCVSVMDLSTTLNVIYFSLITSSAVMLIHIATGVFGFIYGPPKSAELAALESHS
jgi:O-antigen/teichoic acid export membrane protein